MKNRLFKTLPLLLIIVLAGCKGRETQSNISDEQLCNCVTVNEAGEWDGKLSDDCINFYLQRFGDDLSSMHNWFMENCPDYKLKIEKPRIET